MQREVGGGFVAGEVVAERDAVVRLTALVAGDRDARIAVLEDRFRGGDAGVSAADDQHVRVRRRRRAVTGSTRIAVAFRPG